MNQTDMVLPFWICSIEHGKNFLQLPRVKKKQILKLGSEIAGINL